ncbi:hypothetical protein TNCT_673341 [Trichonephila clavata]|uniref:Uncharacterized protein n=1 Tax=Trichonephila clavata TaxID=2740835 RepID=A0A8X6GQN4_TRICU|nr:hypothetical protein TNCT_673341 [Trichonephila clavata]
MQCFESLDTMELVFQQCMSLYSTIHASNLSWTAGYFAEQKMHPSHNKQWFKTVHEYFKDSDEQHGFIRQAVLETLVGVRIALGNIQREKYCFYTPSPATVDFVFQQSSTRHVSLDYKAMLQTCQWTS